MVLDSFQESIESWLLKSEPNSIDKSESSKFKQHRRSYGYTTMINPQAQFEGAEPADPHKKGVVLTDYEPLMSYIPATVYLCLAFIVMFVFQFFIIPVEVGSQEWIQFFAFSAENPSVRTLFISIFSHGGVLHLIVNTIAIFSFGVVVEFSLSRKQLIGLFMLSALVAALTQGVFDLLISGPSIPSLGSSGGAFGIVGYLLRKRPKQTVQLFFVIPIKLWVASAFLVVGSLGLMVFVDPYAFRIAHIAHLAGFSVGFIASSIVETPIPDGIFE